MRFHLAQVNIARARTRFDDPVLSDLTNRIAEINALAESSPGFVWRFQSAPGDLTYLRPFDGYFRPFEPERIFFNMSVWETIDDLKNYVFRSAHMDFFRQKKQWMSELEKAHLALWWVPVGHVLTVEESRDKLLLIERDGPSAEAFTFAHAFPGPK